MKKLITTSALATAALVVAWAAWAGSTGEDPPQDPPFGFAFSGDASGIQLSGTATGEAPDVPSGPNGVIFAADLVRTVLRLEKGGAVHGFFHELTCDDARGLTPGIPACSVDPCRDDYTVCTVSKQGKQTCEENQTLVDLTQLGSIQQCVTEGLSGRILNAFDLSGEIKLKDASSFINVFGTTPDGDLAFFTILDLELSVK
jgi:hypothetical protein